MKGCYPPAWISRSWGYRIDFIKWNASLLQVHRLLGRSGGILTESYNICVCCQCIKLYPYFYTVFANFMIVLLCFPYRFFLQGSHMEDFLNSLRVITYHVRWDQRLQVKLVCLVISHQCLWICLLVRGLKLAQDSGHTWERFLVIVHPQTLKLLCRFGFFLLNIST